MTSNDKPALLHALFIGWGRAENYKLTQASMCVCMLGPYIRSIICIMEQYVFNMVLSARFSHNYGSTPIPICILIVSAPSPVRSPPTRRHGIRNINRPRERALLLPYMRICDSVRRRQIGHETAIISDLVTYVC